MFVNVPMAACALALAWRGVAAGPPPVRSGSPDVLGAVLATAGMTLLVFGVVRTDLTLGLTLGAALLVAAVLIALTVLRGTSPTPPDSAIRARQVRLTWKERTLMTTTLASIFGYFRNARSRLRTGITNVHPRNGSSH